MRSSFRIDKNSVINSGEDSVVRLPNLEDLLEKEEETASQGSEVQETAEDRLLAAKQKQLRQLQEEQEKTRLETEKMLREAREACDEIRSQAAQEGYRLAYEQAQAAVAEERAEEKKAFEQLALAFRETERQRAELAEEGIAAIAMTVAEKILTVALEREDEAYMGIVRNAASILNQQSKKRMRISERDFQRYFASADSDLLREMESAGVEIISDPTLNMGDCIMESDFGTVNTGVKNQLKHIMKELKEV